MSAAWDGSASFMCCTPEWALVRRHLPGTVAGAHRKGCKCLWSTGKFLTRLGSFGNAENAEKLCFCHAFLPHRTAFSTSAQSTSRCYSLVPAISVAGV